MQVTLKTKDGIAIIEISGRMVFDEALFRMREHIRKLLQSGTKAFVLDVSKVSHCDSSACGEIISAYSSIAKAGGSLALVKPMERVRIIWTRIRLTEVLKIFETLPEAEEFVRRSL